MTIARRHAKLRRSASEREPVSAIGVTVGAYGASTPLDERVHLPLRERRVTQTTLADGTVLTDYLDPPLSLVEQLPDPDDDWPLQPEPLARPRPPREGRTDKWERLR